MKDNSILNGSFMIPYLFTEYLINNADCYSEAILSLYGPPISHSISLVSYLATQDLMESQEELKEEGLGYVVMKNLFSRDAAYQLKLVKKSRSTTMRESAERLSLSKKVS